MVTFNFPGVGDTTKQQKIKKEKTEKRKTKKTAIRHEDGMAAPPCPLPPQPAPRPVPHLLPLPPPRGLGQEPRLGAAGGAGGACGVLAGATEARAAVIGGFSSVLIQARRSVALRVGGDLVVGRDGGLFFLQWRLFGWARDTGRCGFGIIVHLQGDGGVKAAPSGAVLVDLESGIGRGTGLATGGGGGSKNDPGTLPWPLPLGCEQHK